MLTDWLFWGSGIALGIAGLALLYWSLFHDRSRGRRRCPKCWYDMSGTEGLRCPECGRDGKSKRMLRRTRRRWRFALLGAVLTVAGSGVGWGRQVRKLDVIRATPTAAIIALYPWFEDYSWQAELLHRVDAGIPRQWEYRFLVDRCVSVLESSAKPTTLIVTTELLAHIEDRGRNRPNQQPWGSWASASEFNPQAVIALAGLLEHDDNAVQLASLKALGRFMENAKVATPILLALLGDDDPLLAGEAANVIRTIHREVVDIRDPSMGLSIPSQRGPAVGEFYARFRGCGLEYGRAATILTEGLTNDEPYIRAVSVWGLAQIDPYLDGVAGPILDLMNDPSGFVRYTVVQGTVVLPFDDRLADILTSELQRSRDRHWSTLRAIESQGTEARSMLPHVENLMRPGTLDLIAAIRCFVRIGGDPNRAINAMIDGLEFFASRPAAEHLGHPAPLLMAAVELGFRSDAMVETVKPFLESDDVKTRSSAAAVMISNQHDTEGAVRRLVADRVRFPSEGWVSNPLFMACRQGMFPKSVLEELLLSEDPTLIRIGIDCVTWGADGSSLRDRLIELMDHTDRNLALAAGGSLDRVDSMVEISD